MADDALFFAVRLSPFATAAFLETGRLAAEVTHIVKLGAANFTVAQHFDLFDARAAHQEGTLDADAVAGRAAHREVLMLTALALADNGSLEDLDTLTVAFHDTHVNTHGVAGGNFRKIAVWAFDCFNKVGHGPKILYQRLNGK